MSRSEEMVRPMRKDTSRDEDPRAAILKHAKVAQENPVWVNHVYKKNQPKTIFQVDETQPVYEVKRRQ